VPAHCRMRVFDRDLIRGGHYGQRSCEPRKQAEHMAAPTNAAYVKKTLANSEPSTHGVRAAPLSMGRECPPLTRQLAPALVCKFALAGRPSGQRLHMVSCLLAYRISVKQFTVREIVSLSGSRMSLSTIADGHLTRRWWSCRDGIGAGSLAPFVAKHGEQFYTDTTAQ
jgi:hypothetical protein